jgi:hypothetical protein
MGMAPAPGPVRLLDWFGGPSLWAADLYTRLHLDGVIFVSKDKSDEQTRKDFYTNDSVMQHVKKSGLPKTTGAFREMVASGSGMDLNSSEGSKLMGVLELVTFSKHPQQINIMDKTSGETIVSIPT